jgi:hypothetical protein
MARNTTRRGTGGLLQPITDIVFGYLKEMRLDMKYALRALIKSPGFALVGILSLGIGMGLTTMLYSSKWQVISRELPASANAKYLVMPEKPVSHYYIEQFREQKNMFTGVAALQTGVPFNINFQSVGNSKPSRSSVNLYPQIIFRCSEPSRSADECLVPILTSLAMRRW